MAFVTEAHINTLGATSISLVGLSGTGNYLVACLVVNAITAVTGFSDNSGNTWDLIASNTSTATICRYIYRARLSVPTNFPSLSVTATFASSVAAWMEVILLSGRAVEAREDGNILFSVDGGATSHSLSTITASAGDDLIAFANETPNGTATTVTAGSGWTRRGISTSCRGNVE